MIINEASRASFEIDERRYGFFRIVASILEGSMKFSKVYLPTSYASVYLQFIPHIRGICLTHFLFILNVQARANVVKGLTL